jgi:hypothetical protein
MGMSIHIHTCAVVQLGSGASKVQLKPVFELEEKTRDNGDVRKENVMIGVMLICKWGGQITHAGKQQTKDYVPVFWDEMLRPCPPPPPDVTDDWNEDSINVNTNLQTLTTEILGADPAIMHELSSFSALSAVSHDEDDYSKEDKALRALYEDPNYRDARFDFLRGMRVFASGEDRVRSTAQEFIEASLKTAMDISGEQQTFQVPLQSDAEVMVYLDDIAPDAKKALKTAKSDVARLVCSNVNYFKQKAKDSASPAGQPMSPSRPQTPVYVETEAVRMRAPSNRRGHSSISSSSSTSNISNITPSLATFSASPERERNSKHFHVTSLLNTEMESLKVDVGKAREALVADSAASMSSSPVRSYETLLPSRSPSPERDMVTPKEREREREREEKCTDHDEDDDADAEHKEKAVEKDVVAVMMRRRRKEIEKEHLRQEEKMEKKKKAKTQKAEKSAAVNQERERDARGGSVEGSPLNTQPSADAPPPDADADAHDEEDEEDINTDEEVEPNDEVSRSVCVCVCVCGV